MTNKEKKNKILERYKDENIRIFVSNLIDKVYRYLNFDKVEHTNFLNLNEYDIAISVLNEYEINYTVFSLEEKLLKKVIFLLPQYISKEGYNEIFEKYISSIKIAAKSRDKLKHKDYMGAIYSLGIKREYIGDIFVNQNNCYVFLINNMSEYILSNFLKVGNEEVKVEKISLFSDEIKNLSYEFEEKEYIVSSLRVDAVLAIIYKKSRSEIKEKILKGDLYINDKEERYLSHILKEGDIVSFRKCGKIKIGNSIRKTRSNRIVISVKNYV